VPAAPLPCPRETESWDEGQREASVTVEVVVLAEAVVDVEVGVGRVVVEEEFGGALVEAGFDVQLAKTDPPRVIAASTPVSLSRRCSVERETGPSSVECTVSDSRIPTVVIARQGYLLAIGSVVRSHLRNAQVNVPLLCRSGMGAGASTGHGKIIPLK
jgi:hypothetical protein